MKFHNFCKAYNFILYLHYISKRVAEKDVAVMDGKDNS